MKTTYHDRMTVSLDDLIKTLRFMKNASGRRAEEIYIETTDGPNSNDGGVRVRLIEETLSDQSTVFNIEIGG